MYSLIKFIITLHHLKPHLQALSDLWDKIYNYVHLFSNTQGSTGASIMHFIRLEGLRRFPGHLEGPHRFPVHLEGPYRFPVHLEGPHRFPGHLEGPRRFLLVHLHVGVCVMCVCCVCVCVHVCVRVCVCRKATLCSYLLVTDMTWNRYNLQRKTNGLY